MLMFHKSVVFAGAVWYTEKERNRRQSEATDRQIDALMYALYGLTEEEIGIVEGV
jgi:hypothetical protein